MSRIRSTISMARSTPAQNDRGPASSTSAAPPHAAAHRCTTGAAARSDRSAASPPVTMPATGRSGVSDTARITATGRPAAAAASGAGLHVRQDRPGGRARPAPPSAPGDRRCDHGPRRTGQSRPPQLAGQHRRGRADHAADLGADDQVARAEVRGSVPPPTPMIIMGPNDPWLSCSACAPRAWCRSRCAARWPGECRPRRGGRPGPRCAAARRRAADPPRRVRRAGLAVARPGDGLRHALPPEVWAVTYRPSALTGKASRYR